MNEVIVPTLAEDPLSVLRRCDGYYLCPKDDNGKRLGPLVGYASKDAQGRQRVGDVYANFAAAERHGPVLNYVATDLAKQLQPYMGYPPSVGCTGFCGAPEGGKALATTLATKLGLQYIFPEKKVTALATASSREVSELFWGRHKPQRGERWGIVEDVCNHLSTTEVLKKMIESCEAEVIVIACYLNRSLQVEDTFLGLPVLSQVRKKILEYEQDDPEVANDIAAGNVVWKPKNEWGWLMEAMG